MKNINFIKKGMAFALAISMMTAALPGYAMSSSIDETACESQSESQSEQKQSTSVPETSTENENKNAKNPADSSGSTSSTTSSAVSSGTSSAVSSTSSSSADSTSTTGTTSAITSETTATVTTETATTTEETVSDKDAVKYTVTFLDADDKVLSTQTVSKTDDIVLPETPVKSGYTFKGWDKDIKTLVLTEDITVKPIFERTLVQKKLETTVDGKSISIEGKMPENAEIVADKVESTNSIENKIEGSVGKDADITVYDAFDIKIKVGDEMYQPEDFDQTVNVSIKNISAASQKDTDSVKVFHINESDKVEEVAASVDDDSASFSASSFSTYVIAGVTYDTSNGMLLENDYAKAYLFPDGRLVVEQFKKDRYDPYPWEGYEDKITSLTIEDGVTFIGCYAFDGCKGIKGDLIIPSSIKSIGRRAFCGCTGFTGSLTIPSSVATIGDMVFDGCTGLTGNLIFTDTPSSPSSLKEISQDAFEYCKFTGSLTIPSSVKIIGINAFRWCNAFDGTLTIPSSVTTIKGSAFESCSGFAGTLTFLEPSSVTSIDNDAFMNCSGFTGNLTIPSSVTSIDNDAFMNCSGFTGNLTIPSSVTSIGWDAFEGCSGFTGNLTIPSSVTSIDWSAFEDCSGFTGNLTIPSSVTSIKSDAFEGCSGFTGRLTIPSSVTSIGWSAFERCSGFTGNLTIPSSVTSIGDEAFMNCSGFTGNLTIPSSVTSIGCDAFEGCSGFTGNLTIPSSVTSIDWGAFEGCSGFTGNLTIPSSVTSIKSDTFEGCSGFTGNLTIPSSVTSIDWGAFEGCSGFTGNLTIPSSVTSIKSDAFEGCSGFTGNLTIPSSVTSIDRGAFKGCSGFTGNLTIPSSVTSIKSDTFGDCPGINHLIFYGNPNCDATAFLIDSDNSHVLTAQTCYKLVQGNYVETDNLISDDVLTDDRRVPAYCISFNTNNGSAVPEQVVAKNEKALKPAAPTRNGYSFDNWYTESALTDVYDFDTAITKNTTVYAKWTALPVPASSSSASSTSSTSSTASDTEKNAEEKISKVSSSVSTPILTHAAPAAQSTSVKHSQPYVGYTENGTIFNITDTASTTTSGTEAVKTGDKPTDTNNKKSTFTTWHESSGCGSKPSPRFTGIFLIIVLFLAVFGIILSVFFCLRKTLVENREDSDEGDFRIILKTFITSKKDRLAETDSPAESIKVWSITVDEETIDSRDTDHFKIVMNKSFCKLHNGEDLVVTMENENRLHNQYLRFTIDGTDNEIVFDFTEPTPKI
jgi:uncharacterized repeat protein (TIGR02543 family)